MTAQQILSSIREAAPGWARWLCVSRYGSGWFHVTRGQFDGDEWQHPSNEPYSDITPTEWLFRDIPPCAINLWSGLIHVQSPDGSIAVATMKMWGAELGVDK